MSVKLWSVRSLAILVACAVGLAGLSGAAEAGTAVSSNGYYTIGSINYVNYAAINTNPTNNHQSYAVTVVYSSNATIPSGYAGAQPRKYDSGGSLVCTGSFSYNSGALAPGVALNPSGCFANIIGTWASKGQTKGWNAVSMSYQTYTTFLSPNQNS